MNIDLSVVIVNYRTPKLTIKCIESIKQFTENVEFEIIVVDNNSGDGSVEQIRDAFSDIQVIPHNDNAGTSIAYNIGIKAANGNYILIQNSDTEYYENSIKIALDEYKRLERNETVGLLACQIKGFDGVIQYNSNMSFLGFKHFLRANPICIKLNFFQGKETLEKKAKRHNMDHEPAWLGIPFGIFNKDICVRDNLYFDQDIFMYYDDEEWCYRLLRKGYKHKFINKTAVLHVNGASSEEFSEWRFGQITVSRLLFMLKSKGKVAYLVLGILFSFNYLIYRILNKKIKDISEASTEALELLIIKKYYFKVFAYSQRTSTSHNYLKYDVNSKLI